MPDAVLVICGEGPLKAELLEKVENLGISDKVFFTGFISDVKSALEKMDVFVMPSLTEGMPIVLLEAMALGKFIIATGVGGIPQMLDKGRAGVVVEAESASSIAKAIKSLELDNAAAESRARVAKQVFDTRFSSLKMAESYLNLYQSLII
jgi:glycosyltransferase involved in cell wall biosynthesis